VVKSVNQRWFHKHFPDAYYDLFSDWSHEGPSAIRNGAYYIREFFVDDIKDIPTSVDWLRFVVENPDRPYNAVVYKVQAKGYQEGQVAEHYIMRDGRMATMLSDLSWLGSPLSANESVIQVQVYDHTYRPATINWNTVPSRFDGILYKYIKVQCLSAWDSYDYTTGVHHHHHLCTRCRQVHRCFAPQCIKRMKQTCLNCVGKISKAKKRVVEVSNEVSNWANVNIHATPRAIPVRRVNGNTTYRYVFDTETIPAPTPAPNPVPSVYDEFVEWDALERVLQNERADTQASNG
jgi:hypothetical protein